MERNSKRHRERDRVTVVEGQTGEKGKRHEGNRGVKTKGNTSG
jgi:hypothetical protein